MKFNVTSHRGHHEADVMDPQVGKVLFDKLCGRSVEPLPEGLKETLPENFKELTGLWKSGKLSFVPAAVEEGGSDNAVIMKEWDPNAKEILLISMQAGG